MSFPPVIGLANQIDMSLPILKYFLIDNFFMVILIVMGLLLVGLISVVMVIRLQKSKNIKLPKC
jgi:hypothetical protein